MRITLHGLYHGCWLLLLFTFTSQAQPLELETITLFNDQLAIDVPNDFVPMDIETVKKKYPLTNEPTFVYTNESTEVNISFKKVNKELIPNHLPKIKSLMEEIYQQFDPKVTELVVDNQQALLFDFITPLPTNSGIHNLMLFFPLGKQTVIINFNVIKTLEDNWLKKGHFILLTTKVLK